MSRFYLSKIVVFIMLLILLVGFVFFRKDKNDPELSQSEIERQQLIENVKKEEELLKDEKKELTEEYKAKIFAENFTTIYYSYTWGNFSNIESQYYYMTNEMKDREKGKVREMKKGIENQPQKYFTARAKLTDSVFISYSETKAVLKINLSIDNFAGAIVQRDTMVWVDEKGDYYEGDTKNLIINTVYKNVEINLIKIDDKWKVDKIREIEL